jgi:putative DNA primase/helicase
MYDATNSQNVTSPISKSNEGTKSDSQPPPLAAPQSSEDWLGGKVEAWNDGEGNAYVTFTEKGRAKHHSVDDAHFREWLGHAHYSEKSKTLRAPALADLVEHFREQAACEGPKHRVALRVAVVDEEEGKRLYVDNVGPNGVCLVLSPDREPPWEVVTEPSVRFLRPAEQRPFPMPEIGGSIYDLQPLLPNCTDEGFHQIVGFMLGCFVPNQECPVLSLSGPQGSGKSKLTAMVKELVDPRIPALSAPPHQPLDLLIMCKNMHVSAFDNGSRISPAMSDAFCQAVSGTGAIEKRKLYTNAGLSVVRTDRCRIILNGIPELAERPDLADRVLTVKLSSLTERRTERELLSQFDAVKGKVLGALLRAVATALRTGPSTPKTMPRLADWACFVTSAETALGLQPNTIVDAYWAGREDAVDAVLEASVVASAILLLREKCIMHGKWEGTLSTLLADLKELSGEPFRLPHSERGLSDELRRLGPMLAEAGVQVTDLGKRRQGNGGRRTYLLTFSPPEADEETKSDAADHRTTVPEEQATGGTAEGESNSSTDALH